MQAGTCTTHPPIAALGIWARGQLWIWVSRPRPRFEPTPGSAHACDHVGGAGDDTRDGSDGEEEGASSKEPAAGQHARRCDVALERRESAQARRVGGVSRGGRHELEEALGVRGQHEWRGAEEPEPRGGDV